jgi:hypothetical protein
MRQQDEFGHAYRVGFADQNRRSYPYLRSSLAYAAYRAGCDYGLATRPNTGKLATALAFGIKTAAQAAEKAAAETAHKKAVAAELEKAKAEMLTNPNVRIGAAVMRDYIAEQAAKAGKI